MWKLFSFWRFGCNLLQSSKVEAKYDFLKEALSEIIFLVLKAEFCCGTVLKRKLG